MSDEPGSVIDAAKQWLSVEPTMLEPAVGESELDYLGRLCSDFHLSRLAGYERMMAEAKSGLEHYADESFWDDPNPDSGYAAGTLYNYEDEIFGPVPGYLVARSTLKSIKALEGKDGE